jgi:hypothetical protein
LPENYQLKNAEYRSELNAAKNAANINVATWTALGAFLGFEQRSQLFRLAVAVSAASFLATSRPCSAKSAHHPD